MFCNRPQNYSYSYRKAWVEALCITVNTVRIPNIYPPKNSFASLSSKFYSLVTSMAIQLF